MNYGFHCSDSHETRHHSTTLLHCISFISVEKYGRCGVVTTHYDTMATRSLSAELVTPVGLSTGCELTASVGVVEIQTWIWTLRSAGRLIQLIWSLPSCLAGRSDVVHFAVSSLSFAEAEGRRRAAGFHVYVSRTYRYLSRTASITASRRPAVYVPYLTTSLTSSDNYCL